MLIVEQTKDGVFLHDEIFEVNSIETWAAEMNKKSAESGTPNHKYIVVSPRKVEYLGEEGKVGATFHVCQRDPFKLV